MPFPAHEPHAPAPTDFRLPNLPPFFLSSCLPRPLLKMSTREAGSSEKWAVALREHKTMRFPLLHETTRPEQSASLVSGGLLIRGSDLVVVFTTLSLGLQDFYGLQMGCTAQLREDERIISPAASANAAAIPRQKLLARTVSRIWLHLCHFE